MLPLLAHSLCNSNPHSLFLLNVFPSLIFLVCLLLQVKRSSYAGAPVKENRALTILRDVFLANVPVYKNNFHPKCIYVGVMLRRMMEAMLNKDTMDDRVRCVFILFTYF
uniref:DNA-directed RNA polymerase III subunit 2 n=1 Tax=Rhizophora mucronata TaxID=61149 RepID=A0A2P2MN74_RHIMU